MPLRFWQLLFACVVALAVLAEARPEHSGSDPNKNNARAGLAKLAKLRRSARHHHNAEFTLNHTHTRSKFRSGHLHHFEHFERVGSAHAHMFNFFRLAGDFLHLGAFGFLLFHLHSTRSCEGISLRTQAMYL